MIYKLICKNCNNEFSTKKHSLYLKRKYCSSKCSQLATRGIHRTLTEEHKKNIGLSQKGRISPLRGKTFEEKYGLERSLKIRKNMSKGREGIKFTEEHIKNIGLSKIGHETSIETRKKISNANAGEKNGMFGRHPSKETLRKKRETRIKTKDELGYYHSPKTKEKISISTKKLWKNEDYRKSHREKWNDEEFRNQWIKDTLKGLLIRPTSFERKISDLCFKNNLPFIYTGDGSFLINYKNPDFINEKNKIVIEVFYSWFKVRDYGSVDNYKDFCRKKYNPSGWEVIFIDETEVDINNWEEICLNKIKNTTNNIMEVK